MADIEERTLRDEARQCGGEAVVLDIRDQAALAELAERAAEARLVCSNAGVVSPRAPVWSATDGDLS
jgi:NAD(P)-dependent dehydrogenase (short-subunit alcohol dehydrogenase family)